MNTQIARLRSRLVAYRNRRGANGAARPWKSVLYDILTHPETQHCFPADGSEPEFKEEALRRFGQGLSNSTPDKRADIKTFLVLKGFLTEKELEEDPYDMEAALALHRHLASSDPLARDMLNDLQTHYVAENRTKLAHLRVTLSARLNECGDYIDLEERYEVFVDPDAELEQSEARWIEAYNRKLLDQKRRGFGYICGEARVLYLFLWNGSRNDLVSYVQVPPFQSFKNSGPGFLLMRSGATLPDRYAEPAESGQPLLTANLFCFDVPGSDRSEAVVKWGQTG